MSHLLTDPKLRFGDRVEVYRRFRPRWPDLLAHLLREQGILPERAVVADIGAGTGLSAEPFLRAGHAVVAVEPNPGMRHAAEQALAGRGAFTARDGSAERTGLEDHSVDLVVAAQAFHWFERERAQREFSRILKPAAWVLLMWNLRDTAATPFDGDWERLIRAHGTDYSAVRERHRREEELAAFLNGGRMLAYRLPNHQLMDRMALQGRLLSSSYLPGPGDPAREPLLADANRLFDRHQHQGLVRLTQHSELYLGRVPRA